MSITLSRTMTTLSVAAVLVVAACGDDEPGADDAGDTSSPAPTEPEEPGPALTDQVDLPDSPAGDQTRWVLEQLELDSGPEPDDAAERFHESFLAEVPPEQVATVFAQLRGYGPFTAVSYVENGTQATSQAIVEMTADGAEGWHLYVTVGEQDEIVGLFLEAPVDVPEVGSWEEFDAAFGELGAEFSVYAASESDGSWETVHATPGDGAMPLGSIFKLYVLGAVQQAVLDGEVEWSDEITVTDDVRSLPSGELQDAETGSTVTVAEAAEKMISISDNTATDMLIDLVGRETVEDTVAELGHHDPGLLSPLLGTRELFQLGWGGDPGVREEWRDADPGQRRELIEELPDGALDIDLTTITDSVWQYDLDWFATGEDIAAAHRALQELDAEDGSGTLRDLMAVNPAVGLEVEPDAWPYIGFKGGSAPGVYALSWYIEDADGDGHVFVLQLAADDPAVLASQVLIVGLAERGLQLLIDG